MTPKRTSVENNQRQDLAASADPQTATMLAELRKSLAQARRLTDRLRREEPAYRLAAQAVTVLEEFLSIFERAGRR